MSKLTVASSPHIRHGDTTRSIMLDVLIALAPAAVAGIVLFGAQAAAVICTCVVSAVLFEFLCCKIFKKPNTIGDLSAAVTGLILALNLPSTLPLWMAVIGSAIAIIVVKQMFGGIGHNFVNPAITARIVLMVSFTGAMSNNWVTPLSVDAITSATPLAGADVTLKQLLLGIHAGCIGETSALMLIIGGLYLCARKVITPVIPLSFILSAAALSAVLGTNPVNAVLSGGLLLGAIFMATDYVTSPTSNLGKVIFGVGCGIITVIIREFGSLPEGVSFSIILMNILVPHINSLTMPKPFGYKEAEGK